MILNRFLLPISLIVSFSFVLILGSLDRLQNTKDRFLIPPPENIQYLSFGFSESMADSLWLRWIQDADNCQTYLKPTEKIPTVPKPEGEASRFYDFRRKVCDVSWSYKMLDSVTLLAPRFKMPYLAGAISLAVMTEDYEGASKIFDRGLQMYPDDWTLAYRAAYHYMIDQHDRDRAAQLLSQAVNHGAPSWMHKLASRLYTENGEWELALRTLLAYRQTMKGKAGVEEVEQKIADLKAKIQRRPTGEATR